MDSMHYVHRILVVSREMDGQSNIIRQSKAKGIIL
jgi:hypothetical protein